MHDVDVRTSEPITFDEFMKIDLRVGTVKEAERVPKSEKLIRIQVGFGNFERQILAGVGLSVQPTDLVGKQYIFVVNIPPKKMMGVESHGMLLATGAPESLTLIAPMKAVQDGCRFS
jgi:methionyl-tRNA synthetase